MGVMSAVVSGAQAIMGYAAQRQDAKNQREAAKTAFTHDQRQLSLRQIQEADAASQKKQLNDLEAAELEADARVEAAGAGVSGISVDNIAADIRRRGARNRQTVSENTRMITAQLQQDKHGQRNTGQSRINAAPNPSPLGLVAGLVGAGLSGYNTYNKFMT